MKTRSADVHWDGRLRDGNGQIELESGAFTGPYSYGSRFEEAGGTNPEELIGAASASCFTMALALNLEEKGHPPEELRTSAAVTLDPDALEITTIELVVDGAVPGIDAAAFREAAEAAKDECPVSKALAGVDISIEATLEG
ncbi:MAG: OsmC family peroxiredoxin [Halodesulfurarchaeum sp.]